MTLDELRDALQAGRLERLAREVERISLPAIRITAYELEEDALPIGTSKFGGLPDQPTSFHWPVWRDHPLAFLAQFHLPDLAPYDSEHVLPPAGTLSFFYEADTQPWGFELSDRGAWQVTYIPADSPLQRARPPTGFPLPSNSRIAPHRLDFAPVRTLPVESAQLLTLALDDEDEHQRYLTVIDPIQGLTHQLLGYPHEMQGAMEGECERCYQGMTPEEIARVRKQSGNDWEVAAAKEWRLLLQLDSITNSNGWTTDWGMTGLIYFWIRKDALARCDFSDVWLQLQTT